jgi:predicted dehydrogenase
MSIPDELPPARTPEAAEAPSLRWGVLGTGWIAELHTTLLSDTPTTATVAGTDGTLFLPGPFYQPGDMVFTSAAGDRRLTYTEPQTSHDALHFEAAEVARCIAAGELESPLRPVGDSLQTLRVMDEIRKQIGAALPDET